MWILLDLGVGLRPGFCGLLFCKLPGKVVVFWRRMTHKGCCRRGGVTATAGTTNSSIHIVAHVTHTTLQHTMHHSVARAAARTSTSPHSAVTSSTSASDRFRAELTTVVRRSNVPHAWCVTWSMLQHLPLPARVTALHCCCVTTSRSLHSVVSAVTQCAVVTRRCRDAAAWYVAHVCRCVTAMRVYGVTVSAAAVVSYVCGWGGVQ